MKAILFGCLVIIFGSCSKPTIDLHFSPGSFTDEYSWGSSFNITPDSSRKVSADITADGITSHFSAIGFNTTFVRDVFTQNNIDSNLISVYAYDSRISANLQIKIVNILTEGTYNIDNTYGLNKAVSASFTIGNDVYPGDNAVLAGTVTIDTLTTTRIHGSFNITCGKGAKTVDVRNGNFAGNF